jgi:hypothetical protein
MKMIFTTLLALSLTSISANAACVIVETEQFENKGGWTVDSLFIDQMGSSFLLAHGMGKPVKDASTTVSIPKSGKYHIYARTRNWTAPWSKEAAGKFKIIVDGKELADTLGTNGDKWAWQQAGVLNLQSGNHKIALHDLTGFEGRCDAICLTTNPNNLPDQVKQQSIQSEKAPAPKTIKADFVVAGGGIAGTCAAISAARLGIKVALVQDRPMLGGANSSEVRVHLGGFQNIGPYPRLGDVVAEIGPAKGGNAQPAERYEDKRKLDVVAAEKNISLFLNTRITGVERINGTITAAIGRDVITGAEIRFEAPIFADCTGDGALGYLAGADFRMGREGRNETGEDMAPETGDKMTMGSSVQWYTKDTGKNVPFPMQPWMLEFSEKSCEYNTRGDWDWETGMMRDQINDFEHIRDYGMLVVYSNWGFVKNLSAKKNAFANKDFVWIAHVAGKRESRRLLGDHILTQQDVFEERPCVDGTCFTTWAIDLHYPMPKNTKNFQGEPFRSICTHNRHYGYTIPYRCFYSRNVPNLFMAGRNISVTHVALGTVRVMRTTGMMGEVVGMAASICKKNNCLPRKIYESHLDELKALMTKGVGTGKPQPPQDYNRGGMKKRK